MMTYEFGHDAGYDPDKECKVLVESSGLHGGISYNAECSECGAGINIMGSPRHCPNCDREIVGVEGDY